MAGILEAARAWLSAAACSSPQLGDPDKRALWKPEANWEVESGLEAHSLRCFRGIGGITEWYQAVRRFFSRYDYFIVPTAQLFPFDINSHGPPPIAGTRTTTYHEWMKCVLPITMSGCPAPAAPVGFS